MISNLLLLKCNVISRQETIDPYEVVNSKYVWLICYCIYHECQDLLSLLRQVMELKECQALRHISASHYACHGVPPATIESEGVYDNI